MHAAAAELTCLAAQFEALECAEDFGCASPAHWLSIQTGLDVHYGRELLRVGRAMRELPLLSRAFFEGELSLDKMRAVTQVAMPDDEEIWLNVARASSGQQLARICQLYARALNEEQAERQMSGRYLRMRQTRDGLVKLTAKLLPEEAELIGEEVMKLELRLRRRAEAEGLPEPAPEAQTARDADALVEVFRRHAATDPDSPPEGQPLAGRVVVHVDAALLAGRTADGDCRGKRFRLPAEMARMVACDGEVQVQTEQNGVPIDLGRARRLVSPALARALRARDKGCRFPGCGRQRVHFHHLVHWARGGHTDLSNLVSFCEFHHHRLHRGLFRVTGTADRLVFETRDGRLIGPVPPQAAVRRGHPVNGHPEARYEYPVIAGKVVDGMLANRDWLTRKAAGLAHPLLT